MATGIRHDCSGPQGHGATAHGATGVTGPWMMGIPTYDALDNGVKGFQTRLNGYRIHHIIAIVMIYIIIISYLEVSYST